MDSCIFLEFYSIKFESFCINICTLCGAWIYGLAVKEASVFIDDWKRQDYRWGSSCYTHLEGSREAPLFFSFRAFFYVQYYEKNVVW